MPEDGPDFWSIILSWAWLQKFEMQFHWEAEAGGSQVQGQPELPIASVNFSCCEEAQWELLQRKAFHWGLAYCFQISVRYHCGGERGMAVGSVAAGSVAAGSVAAGTVLNK